MRVVFIGATKFGARCVARVSELQECSVVGIVTAPEVFSISYRPQGVRNVLHADLCEVAARLKVPCHVMTTNMTDPSLIEKIRVWRPDFILVVGWYHVVPSTIRNIAPAAGLHASLLPHYRGGAPLVWTIINGEKLTGITLFLFDDGIDTGPIIAQAEERILDTDTIATLYGRIELLGLQLLTENLPRIARGERTLRRQPSGGSTYPQRSPDAGLIDWTWEARRVYNFIRAQTRPYPGAYATFFGERLTIWRASLAPVLTNAAPGIPLMSQMPSQVLVSCGSGTTVSLDEAENQGVQLDGKRLRDWFERAATRV